MKNKEEIKKVLLDLVIFLAANDTDNCDITIGTKDYDIVINLSFDIVNRK